MVVSSVIETPHLNIRIFKKHFNSIHLLSNHNIVIKLKTKLRGLSPRANYTDRAAAAGRRS